MSNCVVGSGGSWLPCSTIAEHSVEGCDHFSHDGDDDDLGFLSAAAGFRSRRGPSHDSTLVTPHNAPFSTYKAARVHIASQATAPEAGRIAENDHRTDTPQSCGR